MPVLNPEGGYSFVKKILLYAALICVPIFAVMAPAISADSDLIESKLETIVKNQEKILAEIAEIKAELKVIKVRATLR